MIFKGLLLFSLLLLPSGFVYSQNTNSYSSEQLAKSESKVNEILSSLGRGPIMVQRAVYGKPVLLGIPYKNGAKTRYIEIRQIDRVEKISSNEVRIYSKKEGIMWRIDGEAGKHSPYSAFPNLSPNAADELVSGFKMLITNLKREMPSISIHDFKKKVKERMNATYSIQTYQNTLLEINSLLAVTENGQYGPLKIEGGYLYSPMKGYEYPRMLLIKGIQYATRYDNITCGLSIPIVDSKNYSFTGQNEMGKTSQTFTFQFWDDWDENATGELTALLDLLVEQFIAAGIGYQR